MTPNHPLDPRVELSRGQRVRVVSLMDLAERLGLPVARVRSAVFTLLLLPRPPDEAGLSCPDTPPSVSPVREGETPEGEGVPSGTFPNVSEGPNGSDSVRTVPSPESENVPERPLRPERSDAREGLALTIAAALDDPGSLAAYERMAGQHPPELLRRALVVTLRVPAAEIRRSRGAYFTALVARLSSSSPYARTSPPSS